MKNYHFRIYCLIVLIALAPCGLYSQSLLQGDWRDHLSYRDCYKVAETPDWVFCAASSGLVSVNKVDETIRRHSKVTGLSDVKVSTISYSSEYDYLIVGYKNGNIDFLREGENPFNLQDIKRRIMTSEKQINNIIFYGRYAYLACSFAIVALDIENKEIKETYYLGENGNYLKVNDIAILDNRLYAATDYGIYTASLINSNLLDYSYWSKLTFIPQPDNPYKLVENYNGQIFAVYKNLTTGSDQIIVISGNESHPWSFKVTLLLMILIL